MTASAVAGTYTAVVAGGSAPFLALTGLCVPPVAVGAAVAALGFAVGATAVGAVAKCIVLRHASALLTPDP